MLFREKPEGMTAADGALGRWERKNAGTAVADDPRVPRSTFRTVTPRLNSVPGLPGQRMVLGET
jgi:hypothetical protein